MSVNKKILTAALLAVYGFAGAQTIDELSDLNRRQMIADAKEKLEKKTTPAPVPAGLANPMGAVSVPVPGMPNSAVGGASVRPVVRNRQNAPAPVLVAIYGVGGQLITELSDGGFEAKYRVGDPTPSGWKVSSISKRMVTLTGPQVKGKASRVVSLPFGIKPDEPKERDKEFSSAPSGLSMPPLPPNFSALTR